VDLDDARFFCPRPDLRTLEGRRRSDGARAFSITFPFLKRSLLTSKGFSPSSMRRPSG